MEDGYEFEEWSNGDQDPVTTFKLGDEDTTITPIVKPIVYTITYELDGGSVSGTNPTTYTIEDDDITLINAEKAGYTFEGWTGTDVSELSKEVVIRHGSIGNRTFTAHYSTITYTITYDLDGGTLPGENLTEYDVEDDSFTLVNPTKEGYDFIGWTGANGDIPQVNVTIENGSIDDREYKANYAAHTYTQ